MKTASVKIISALLCVCIVFAAIVFTRTELHGSATPEIILFSNEDIWFQSGRLPVEKVYNAYYIPVSFLTQFDDISVRSNDTLQTFIITRKERFLSFDISTNFAVNQDFERMYIKTAKYHNERYVPAKNICTYLGLEYEEYSNPVTGAVAIRISDSDNLPPLSSVVKRIYPNLFPEVEITTPPPVTQTDTTKNEDTTKTPDTDTTAPKPVLSERVIYITIDGSPSAYTGGILDVLSRYNCPATFFVVGEAAAENADVVSRIAANGHTVALHATSASAAKLTDADEILADIDDQNELMARIIKQKSHIRRAPDGSALSREAAKLLEEYGYFLCDANIKIPASTGTARAASIAIDGIWNNDVAVIRFTDGPYTASALRTVLSFIAENREVCELRVISPANQN